MSGEHTRPPRREDRRKRPAPRRRDMKKMMRAGWIVLGVLLALSVGLLIHLAIDRPAAPAAQPAPATAAPGPAGSAFTGPAAVLTTDEGKGGRTVNITGFDCEYEPPREVVVGRLAALDLTEIAGQIGDNVRAAGWGETVWSVTENGALLLRAKELTPLSAADYDRQTAFLKSAQPENLARTFLENSRLIPLLQNYGLYLGTVAENSGGEISFHGVGDTPGTECSARFDFLFTGAFNQAEIRATYLADAVTTDRLLNIREAAGDAVTWIAGGEGGSRVTKVELRHIRGIPFYVFTCGDGITAYALAVEEDALAAVPGAEQIYHQLLSEGIQDNVAIPGAE